MTFYNRHWFGLLLIGYQVHNRRRHSGWQTAVYHNRRIWGGLRHGGQWWWLQWDKVWGWWGLGSGGGSSRLYWCGGDWLRDVILQLKKFGQVVYEWGKVVFGNTLPYCSLEIEKMISNKTLIHVTNFLMRQKNLVQIKMIIVGELYCQPRGCPNFSTSIMRILTLSLSQLVNRSWKISENTTESGESL